MNKIDKLDFINNQHLPQIHFLEEFESARGSIVEAFNKLANSDLKEEAGTHYHSICEGLQNLWQLLDEAQDCVKEFVD